MVEISGGDYPITWVLVQTLNCQVVRNATVVYPVMGSLGMSRQESVDERWDGMPNVLIKWSGYGGRWRRDNGAAVTSFNVSYSRGGCKDGQRIGGTVDNQRGVCLLGKWGDNGKDNNRRSDTRVAQGKSQTVGLQGQPAVQRQMNHHPHLRHPTATTGIMRTTGMAWKPGEEALMECVAPGNRVVLVVWEFPLSINSDGKRERAGS
jgi:hypothetical protein